VSGVGVATMPGRGRTRPYIGGRGEGKLTGSVANFTWSRRVVSAGWWGGGGDRDFQR
jgi:hypothetical protein